MSKATKECKSQSARIHEVDITNDTLTSRAGLCFFARYLNTTGMLSAVEDRFGALRGSAKGLPVSWVFQQVFCFLLDGSSHHLRYFDSLKQDHGYAATIERAPEEMLSSHAVKRFMQKLGRKGCQLLFRSLLEELWLWRLKVEQPEVVELGLDSMVMDNDEAQVRQGVKPTYKKVKGFHPLQLTWSRYIVDAVFRGGSHHSNHGETAANMLRRAVRLIRRYDEQVPIVVRMDSGFFDEDLFKLCEALGIKFICTGKLYQDIQTFVGQQPEGAWERYGNQQQQWDYMEFTDQRGTWDTRWRALYLRPCYEGKQGVLEFARPESILYTNLGLEDDGDALLHAAGQSQWLEAARIIESSHDRGADELVHRAFKDFGFEELPFERFAANQAVYYCMVTGFLLFESFKYDVCQPPAEHQPAEHQPAPERSAPTIAISRTAYASTVRRQLLDVAGKLVRSGGRLCLKVTTATWERLNWALLWRCCNNPPRLHAA